MSDGTPNLELARLSRLILNILIYLFGSALCSMIIFCILVPLVALCINGTNSVYAYHGYIHRTMVNEAQTCALYGWSHPKSLFHVARSQAYTIITPASEFTRQTGPEAAPASDSSEAARYYFRQFNFYVQNTWLQLLADMATIAVLRGYLMLPFLPVVIMLWLGYFFSGEYTARLRFDDAFQPSSNRTKFWFQFVRFFPVAAITLPVIFVAMPVYFIFFLCVSIECYAIYKMRTESMEIV